MLEVYRLTDDPLRPTTWFNTVESVLANAIYVCRYEHIELWRKLLGFSENIPVYKYTTAYLVLPSLHVYKNRVWTIERGTRIEVSEFPVDCSEALLLLEDILAYQQVLND